MGQSLSSVLVHLVFSTKKRYPFITPEVEKELFPYLATVFRNAGCPTLAINGTEDHIHILFALSRTKTIADMVEEAKTSTSKLLKPKSRILQKFEWQTGYGAFSIGRSQLERVVKYIRDQKEHHRRRTFQDELRMLLKKYEIEYDERYVWN
jgi:REP element-mobilizing transposase RayT